LTEGGELDTKGNAGSRRPEDRAICQTGNASECCGKRHVCARRRTTYSGGRARRSYARECRNRKILPADRRGKGRFLETEGAARSRHGRIRHAPMRCRHVRHRHIWHGCVALLTAGMQLHGLTMDAARGRNGRSCCPQNDHGESGPRATRHDHGLPQATCRSNAGMRRLWPRKHTFSVSVVTAEPQGVPAARLTHQDEIARLVVIWQRPQTETYWRRGNR